MKKIIYWASFIWLCIAIACTNDNLPEAGFNLHEVPEISVIAGNEQIIVQWNSPEKVSPEAYYISWEPDNLLFESGSVTVEPSVNSYTITGLGNGVNYKVGIQAVYQNKRSGVKSVSIAPKSSYKPVTDLVAVAGNERVRLQWSRPEGDLLTGYRIEVSPGGYEINLSRPDIERYTVDGLENGIEYELTVYAVYSGIETQGVKTSAIPGDSSPVIASKKIYLAGETIELAYNDMYFTDEVKSVSWLFAPGQTADGKSVQYIYQAPGQYQIQITITYMDDTTETEMFTITVIGIDWECLLNTGSGRGQVKASNPVFADDGTMYITMSGDGTIGDLYAIRPDGGVKWIFTGIGGITYGGGPVVGDDGTIYAGSRDKKLYAVTSSGTEKWSYLCGGNVDCYPAVSADGTVYVISNDNVLHAISSGGVADWTIQLEGQGNNTGAVALYNNYVLAGTNGNMYAYSTTGELSWTSTANVTEISTFAIHGNIVYIPQRGGGGIVAKNIETGESIWSYPAGSSDAYTPVVGKDGSVYFGTKATYTFHAIQPDGSKKWDLPTGRPMVYASPVLDDQGVIYFGTQELAVDSKENSLFAVDTGSGELLWQMDFGMGNDYKFMAGASIGKDGRLYIGTIGSATVPGRIIGIPIYAAPETSGWSTRGGNIYGNNRK